MKCTRMYVIWGGIGLLAAMAVAYFVWFMPRVQPVLEDFPHPTGAVTVGNDHMTMSVPAGWSVEHNNGQVTLTKNNYIVTVDPVAQQASGVEGGRFAEIAQYIPSVRAVVTEQPSDPCGMSDSAFMNGEFLAYSWNITGAEPQAWCAKPTDKNVHWYVSYMAPSSGGYFNYYKNAAGETKSWTMTMGYNTEKVDALPILMDNVALSRVQEDFQSMAISLVIKDKVAVSAEHWEFTDTKAVRIDASGKQTEFAVKKTEGLPSEYGLLAAPTIPNDDSVYFDDFFGKIWVFNKRTGSLHALKSRITSPDRLVTADGRFVIMAGDQDANREVRSLKRIDLQQDRIDIIAKLPQELSYTKQLSDFDGMGKVDMVIDYRQGEFLTIQTYLAADPFTGIFQYDPRTPVAVGHIDIQQAGEQAF